MLVSWEWLKEYVQVDAPVDEVVARLTMAGLNLEDFQSVDGDVQIDLEVTSNRPDCLGHIGVAREMSVLYDRPLTLPAASPRESGPAASSVTSVAIECADLCPQYIARVIRGVKVGPSPDWLRRRLATIGQPSVNNVVDITNYVLMECGQPLHAFDFDKLRGGRIIVRRPQPGEKIVAIDQREYALDPHMCIIADAERPVAIGGVMGGLDTEISDQTVDVLIETADFSAMSVRGTARKLNLHSPSSYRFERGIDRVRTDWASRRCCELILDVCGGELLTGAVVAGAIPEDRRPPVALRFAQIQRILGISIPSDEVVRILQSLGLKPVDERTETSISLEPPSWRRDLTREADLIEEVARIHGYDKIPENVTVPLQLSSRTHRDRITSIVRDVLTAAGCYEAVTLSFVTPELASLFQPRGALTPVTVEHSSRKHENILRSSLIPSLLQARRENERHGVFGGQLFEIARVYLKVAPHEPEAQVEPLMIGLVSGKPFADVKGMVEKLLRTLDQRAEITAEPSNLPEFAPGRGAALSVNGRVCGWMGELDHSVTDRLDLRDAVTVAELELSVLESIAVLTPAFKPLPQFPAIERDLNFVLDDAVTWQELSKVVREAAGPLLEEIGFGGQYRGKQIAAGKKSYVVTLSYRAPDRTLTAEEVDAAQQRIITACEQQLAAALR